LLSPKPTGEVLQTFLCFLFGIQRQRRIVFRGLVLVVERGIFFLQVAGIG
jgi:hypothetical protein